MSLLKNKKSSNTTQDMNSSVVEPPAKKPKTCPKWKLCSINEAFDYDNTYVKYCRYCKDNSKTLFLIHNDDGDYWCYDCKEPVFSRFFCIKCKRKKRSIYNN